MSATLTAPASTAAAAHTSPAPAPLTTRARLIDAAKRRFYRDGFRNVGLDQVLSDVGISRTAFYKHFASKDDLMVGVLEEDNRFVQAHFRAAVPALGGPSPVAQLRALLDVVEQFIERADYHGCIFINAVMEFPLPHDPAHVAAARSRQAIETFVAEIADRAGADDPVELAKELCLIMEGVYVTRQVTGRSDAVGMARRLVDLAIRARVPAADHDGGPVRPREPAAVTLTA